MRLHHFVIAVACVGALGACGRKDSPATTSAPSAAQSVGSAQAPTDALPPASAAAKPGVAEAGQWKGEYQVAPRRIVMKPEDGAIAAWGQDDGKAFAGKGELSLRISPDGAVAGTAQGALGAQRVVGMLDGDHLRLQLLPAATGSGESVAQGTWVGERQGASFAGKLHAASGDGTKVREGTLALNRVGG